MEGQYAKFFSYMTLLSLFSAIRCRPINLLPLQAYNQDEFNQLSNNGRASDYEMDQATTKENIDSISVAYPPEGVGIFRDPLEVLGPKFCGSLIVNLCQVRLFVNADIVTDVVFIERGTKLCDKVCRQYQSIMQFDGPTDVSYMKGYCDYTGMTDFSNISDQDSSSVLHTECTCAYKVRCNQKTNVIMYTFQTNAAGYLKVSFTEPNKKHFIT